MTMPTKILHSTVSGNKPVSLLSGQIAINEADRVLYYLDPQTGSPSSLLDQVDSIHAAVNLIINGAMEIDQINRGNVVANANGYAIDMVKVTNSGTQVVASQQNIDAPPGMKMSLKVSVTTANSSPGSTDFCAISFPIEGYRAQRLCWGTAGTFNNPLSIGFYVKAFRTGVYGLNISNGAGNRGYSTTFTVTASATWQWVTATLLGDTTGTWPTANSRALIISIFMMAGSGLLMTPNTWTAGGQQGVAGQVNGVQSTTDFMQISCMSAFIGYVAPSVARGPSMGLPFAETLFLCQRYWQKSYDYETAIATVTQLGSHELIRYDGGISAANWGSSVRFQTPMMTDPSVTIYSPGTGATGKCYGNVQAVDITAAPTLPSIGQKGFTIFQLMGGAQSNLDIVAHWTADARM